MGGGEGFGGVRGGGEGAGSAAPPVAADEATMLRAFLDYHRENYPPEGRGPRPPRNSRPRCRPRPPMTLGGSVKHLTRVEYGWFGQMFLAACQMPPGSATPSTTDRDWSAPGQGRHPGPLSRPTRPWSPGRRRPRRRPGGSGRASTWLAIEVPPRRQHRTLRWIVVHLIEEYARHNGHADLIRESIDGATDL